MPPSSHTTAAPAANSRGPSTPASARAGSAREARVVVEEREEGGRVADRVGDRLGHGCASTDYVRIATRPRTRHPATFSVLRLAALVLSAGHRRRLRPCGTAASGCSPCWPLRCSGCCWPGSAPSTRSACGPASSSTSPAAGCCAMPRSCSPRGSRWPPPERASSSATSFAGAPPGPALAVLVAALPVALLPSLAWGVGGRVTAVEVPADLRSAATMLSEQPPGPVGLLPWSQYRRYGVERRPGLADPRTPDGRPARGVRRRPPPRRRRRAGGGPGGPRASAARIAAGTPPAAGPGRRGCALGRSSRRTPGCRTRWPTALPPTAQGRPRRPGGQRGRARRRAAGRRRSAPGGLDAGGGS